MEVSNRIATDPRRIWGQQPGSPEPDKKPPVIQGGNIPRPVMSFVPNESEKGIKNPQPFNETPQVVQKTAMKVNWTIFVVLLLVSLPLLGAAGWIYLLILYIKHRETQSSDAEKKEVGQPVVQRPPMISPPVEEKRKGPAFPERSLRVRLSHNLTKEEKELFSEHNKGVSQAEYGSFQTIIENAKEELKNQETKIKEKKSEIEQNSNKGLVESAIFCVKEKLSSGPGLKELEEKRGKQVNEIEGYEKTLRPIQRELKTIYIQHPRFREVLTSSAGLPFRMAFDGEELSSSRRDVVFEEVIGEKLMGWSGENDIDPVGMNIAAQAQLVLVRLSKESDPLVLNDEDRENNPQTVPGSLFVHFDQERGAPIMRIMRTVEAKDGKQYKWTETVRFKSSMPEVTRVVQEIKG